MINSIWKTFKQAEDEAAMWRNVRSMIDNGECQCAKVPKLDGVLSGYKFFMITKNNKAIVVLIDNPNICSRKADELADEERFNDDLPLWFTECSHRVSPVYCLRMVMTAVHDIMEPICSDLIVKGVFFTANNIINLDSCINGYEKLNIVIRDNMDSCLSNRLLPCRTNDAILSYCMDYVRANASKVTIHTKSVDDFSSEDCQDINFNDVLDDFEWTPFDPFKDSSAEDSPYESSEPDEEIKPKKAKAEVDRGRITTLRDLNVFLDNGPHARTVEMDSMPNVEIYYPLPNPQAALDNLTGLDSIKEKVSDFSCLALYNKLKNGTGSATHSLNLHGTFIGNPGTGKSTMGRIWAGLLKEHNQLSHGHFVLATRSSFVGTRWGLEEENLIKILDIAEGGTLMIDEAYSLVSAHPQDPGRIVLPLLLNKLADENYRNISVILAGYPNEMESLLKTNPGITSRFANTFEFPDFSFDQLCEIAVNRIHKYDYEFTPEADAKFKEVLGDAYAKKDRTHFGNARFVANYLERVYLQHARRIVKSGGDTEQLFLITADDIVPNLKAITPASGIGFAPSR